MLLRVNVTSAGLGDCAKIAPAHVATIDGKPLQLGLSASEAFSRIRRPVRGEPVTVVGHAAFGPRLLLRPSMTAGEVAKVVLQHGRPVLIQSTAMVLAGHSGGALLDATGNLLGMVTSHARAPHSGGQKKERIIPRLNFVLPIASAIPLVQARGSQHRF
jgi:S1-C subfamily serine protease